ncbi:hypothetical protein [Actinokineospora diospyrosa]|uniref:Uncharacterized protein n=1 Tax=Actinokineospora diospyrosa TaxID=103728 RepID=A0ABT1IEP6_9PSEU|nr:hypothetical protein [Actinokineospora diospyrosa]MCP2271085.1 hypothetical protein [Actinokineospora diospyrosa]
MSQTPETPTPQAPAQYVSTPVPATTPWYRARRVVVSAVAAGMLALGGVAGFALGHGTADGPRVANGQHQQAPGDQQGPDGQRGPGGQGLPDQDDARPDTAPQGGGPQSRRGQRGGTQQDTSQQDDTKPEPKQGDN